jgi:NAD(P)-dependent dehydrogenase (short-subunit alcohol dehydrogenase family)
MRQHPNRLRCRPQFERGSVRKGLLTLAAALGALATTSLSAQTAPTAIASAGELRPDQQVVFITGSTDGLGREVAMRLAATGAHIIVHGRNVERGREVVDAIAEQGTGSARFYVADLAAMDEVRALGNAILRDYDRIDILINNAGIGSTAPDRQLSPDGYELRFAVNYLSGFLLTHMLLPTIVDSAPSRIINVASAAQTPIDFDDVMLERDYSGGRAYGQSKLAQILLTFDLAHELEDSNVIVNALHPSTFMDTNMVVSTGRAPMTSVNDGAEAVMNLVTTTENGLYFNVQRPVRANDQAYDEDARARLRELSRRLTGLD